MKGLKTTQRDKNKQFYILHNDLYLTKIYIDFADLQRNSNVETHTRVLEIIVSNVRLKD